jgi:predicted nucleotidyltransferase
MGLTTFLQQHRLEARRLFGERELVIVGKQLRGVALTQSEKNRLSRDIRPKLSFIKEASKFSDEFLLKKGQDTKRLTAQAVAAIKEDVLAPRIKRIILFGSVAERTPLLRSDIDIAIDIPGINVRDATLLRKRLLGSVPEGIDVQVYNVLPAKIQVDIDKKGRALK